MHSLIALALAACVWGTGGKEGAPGATGDETGASGGTGSDGTGSGGTGGDGSSAERHHPDGYADPTVHGMAAKYQEESCVECHGADLSGGTAGVSCDTCHASGWRTDCTFCHGGTDNTTGAPPVDLDNSTTDLSFTAHTAHVQGTIHSPFDCAQCHLKPTDVLSSGHFLIGDTTPGVAEVGFTAGLSSLGVYDGAGGCSNLYCHGTGRADDGTQHDGDDASCGSCHAVATSDWSGWSTMSGQHGKHLSAGFSCQECHAATVASDTTFADVSLHVNGNVDTSFPSGMAYEGGQCTGTCHGEGHGGRWW